MSHALSGRAGGVAQSAERDDDHSDLGPLRRRIVDGPVGSDGSGSQPLRPIAREPYDRTGADATSEAIQYATLGLLDGAIVARLECHEMLGTIVIGRGSQADVRLNDPFVHRAHAEIEWDPRSRAHFITHGGGQNGTFVNLQRITHRFRLSDGARIRMGKTELIYRRVWYPNQ